MVKAGLSDIDAPGMKKIIESAPFLAYLDISWNEFSQRGLIKILEAISTNRKLKMLNLSWNQLSRRPRGEPNIREIEALAESVIKAK